VLASNSPRRQQLLQMGGWQFRIRPAEVDESPQSGESPETHVVRLAVEKAQTRAAQIGEDVIILGADTVVVDDGGILGKPSNPQEARTMLEKLRGHVHRVCTGIALVRPRQSSLLTDLCITHVPMRSYSDAEIQDYILTGDPLDKAGAYAIQHTGFHPVDNLTGCFASVMGLPLCHLARTLKKMGLATNTDMVAKCKTEFAYSCLISMQVLSGANIG
jgi:septum formation protein